MTRKNLKRLLAFVLAVSMVMSLLTVTAFADEEVLVCEKEEHVHTQDCYDLVLTCGLEETEGHKHTEECQPETTRELTCGKEETEGHTHTDECWTAETILACGIPEGHVHTVDCYKLADPDGMVPYEEMEIDGKWYAVEKLVCEIPEGHAHTDECYAEQKTLVCELEEVEGHTHTDECWSDVTTYACGLKETEPHTHSDACYTPELVCGKEQHTHTAECYQPASTVDPENDGIATIAGGNLPNSGSLTKGKTYTGTQTLSSTLVVDVDGTVTIENATINANGKGSAIWVKKGTLILKNVTIYGGTGTTLNDSDSDPNSLNGYLAILDYSTGKDSIKCGGGILLTGSSKLEMYNTTIRDNSAGFGGGIAAFRGTNVKVYGGCEIYNNVSSTNGGGGMFLAGDNNVIDPTVGNKDILIHDNKTNSKRDLGGGGFFVDSAGSAFVKNALIYSNDADGMGGGIAGCLHGMVSIVDPDMAAIYENTAKGTSLQKQNPKRGFIDNSDWPGWAHITASNSRDYLVAGYSLVGPQSLGGGFTKWQGMAVDRVGTTGSAGRSVNTFDGKAIKVDGILGLTVTNDSEVKAAAESSTAPKTKIYDNYSAMHGGGIGTNGLLKFGEETWTYSYSDTKISIYAQKSVAVTTGKPQQSLAGYTFELLKDGKVIATATTGADGKIKFENILTSSLFGPSTKNETLTKTLTLREVKDNNHSGVIFDTAERQIQIKVTRTVTPHNPTTESGANSNSVKLYEIKDEIKGVTVTVNGKAIANGATYTTNSVTLKGKANFTNEYKTGTIKIVKDFTVDEGTVGDEALKTLKNATFKFRITGNDNNANVDETVTLNSGNNFTATLDVPVGKYTIEEISPNPVTGFTWKNVTPTKGSVTVTDGGTATFTATNNYTVNKVDLKITKDFKLNGQKLAQFAGAYGQWATGTFTFTISGTDLNGNPVPEQKVTIEFKFENNKLTSETKTIKGLPLGTYTITETEAKLGHTYFEANGVSFKLGNTALESDPEHPNSVKLELTSEKNGATVTFTAVNEYTIKTGNLTVSKTVLNGEKSNKRDFEFTVELSDKSINGQFSGMTFTNGVATFPLRNGESKTAEGLPVGITYTVTEKEAGKNGFITSWTGDTTGKITENGAVVAFTNNYQPKVASVVPQVEKVIKGDKPDNNDAFTFVLTPLHGAPTTMTKENKVTVYGAGTKSFSPIIFKEAGTFEYQISEVKGDILGYTYDETVWTLTVTVVDDGNGNLNATAKYTKVDDTDEAAIATFTNTYTTPKGSLEITKTVDGVDTGDKTFTFTVTGPNDYKATVTLKAGETKTLEGLLLGEYTITEDKEDAQVDGYTLEVTGEDTVTVEYNEVTPVTITNTYTEKKGSLSITKNVVVEKGEDVDKNKEFTFTVTGPNGYKETVTLKAGETKTLTDLKLGDYTITEDRESAAVGGYRVDVTGEETVTVEYNEVTPVTITNTYNKLAQLSITKVLNGGGDKAKDKEFTFTVEGPNGYKTTVTLKGGETKTLVDLERGEYTVTEEQGDDIKIDGYDLFVTDAQTVTLEYADVNKGVTMTNTYSELGSLTIKKTIVGGGDKAKELTFTFDVTDEDGDIVATVTIKGEGSETVPNLKPGKYTVTERQDDIQLEGYVLTVSGNMTAELTYGSKPEIDVTNTYQELGKLTISKEVYVIEGDASAVEGKTFTFYITDINGKLVKTVTLEAGESITVDHLEPGTYTVTEDKEKAQVGLYHLDVTGEDTVTVTYDDEKAVTVTNTYHKRGSLSITKSLVFVGDHGDIESKSFTFDIVGPNGYHKEVTIKAGETATLGDLEPGTYTITERNADVTYYDLTVNGTGDYTVAYDQLTEVSVVNTYQKYGSLTITKGLEGEGGEYAENKVYTFIITGPNNYKKTVYITGSGTVRVDDLKPGVYTVTEEGADIAGFELEVTGDNGDDAGKEVKYAEIVNFEITNKYTLKHGKVTVHKDITLDGTVNPGEEGEDIREDFTFTLSGTTLTGEHYEDTITVHYGDEGSFNNVPYGTYTITEDMQQSDVDHYDFGSVTFKSGDQTNKVTQEDIEAGDAAKSFEFQLNDENTDENMELKLEVTNEYNRKLTALNVRKRISGNFADVNTLWDFTVALSFPTEYVEPAESYTYTVTDEDGNVIGTGTITKTDGTVVIDGETYTVYGTIAQLGNNQTAHIEGLPVGVKYQVTETEAGTDGYYTSYDGREGTLTESAEGSVIVYNSRSRYTTVAVTKNWVNDRPSQRPDSIVVELYQDGVLYATFELNEGNDWTRVWTGMRYGAEFTVREVNVPAGYVVTYGGNTSGAEVNLTITNTSEQDYTSFSVRKVWVGGLLESRPAGITVQLLANGAAYGEPVTLSSANGWAYTWTDLDPEADYTVAEVDVPDGYTVTYTTDGGEYVITNTWAPKTSFTVNKAWFNLDGTTTAPEGASITVTLTRNGVPTGNMAVLSAANNWTYTFEDLDAEDANGDAYTYGVTEAAYAGYTPEYTIVSDNAVTITNRQDVIVNYTQVGVQKVWEEIDGTEAIEALPDSITVNLYRDGELVSSVVLSAANGWSYIWTELEEGDYTVVEVEVEGWMSSIENSGNSFVLTNVRDDTFDIPDDDTPRSDKPDEPLEEIPDDDIPLDDMPKTGDDSVLGLWLTLAALSGTGLIVLSFTYKKHEEREDDED